MPISHTLECEYVGLEEVDDGIWDVYFRHVRLGQMDERTFTIKDALAWIIHKLFHFEAQGLKEGSLRGLFRRRECFRDDRGLLFGSVGCVE